MEIVRRRTSKSVGHNDTSVPGWRWAPNKWKETKFWAFWFSDLLGFEDILLGFTYFFSKFFKRMNLIQCRLSMLQVDPNSLLFRKINSKIKQSDWLLISDSEPQHCFYIVESTTIINWINRTIYLLYSQLTYLSISSREIRIFIEKYRQFIEMDTWQLKRLPPAMHWSFGDQR